MTNTQYTFAKDEDGGIIFDGTKHFKTNNVPIDYVIEVCFKADDIKSECFLLNAQYNGWGYQYSGVALCKYNGGIRFNLERLMELYPNAIIIVGTNFQARGTDRNEVAEALRQVCYRLALPVIDGNRYSGIGRDTELPTGVTRYTDAPDGTPTREYPQYCWVEPDGTYTNVTDKSADAVKKYGRYTYDGKHQTLKGENHIAGFMASQILNYARSKLNSGEIL